MPYVLLKQIKNITEHGQLRTYHPGDTVKVGKQTAIRWVLDGSAEDTFAQVGPAAHKLDYGEFGILIRSEPDSVSKDALGKTMLEVPVEFGGVSVPFEHTFLWNPVNPISERLLNYGWLRISKDNPPNERWEMAANLVSLEATIDQFGTEEDCYQTEKLIGDLRLPVYRPSALWIRKCENSEKVIEEFKVQLEAGAEEHHAFLRALYTKRAMLCTLPQDWTRR